MAKPKTIKCKTLDGDDVEFEEEKFSEGGMKYAHWAADKSYVVLFYKDKQDFQTKERLQMITGKYRDGILKQTGGDHWKNLFCWPTAVLEHEGKLGIVAPTYPKHFFLSLVQKIMMCSVSKGKKKRESGLPQLILETGSWTRESLGIG
jgi:hypothetical protein